MARSALTVSKVISTGLAEPAKGAANVDGNSIPNPSGSAWIEILNGSASPINVTVQTSKAYKGRAVADDVVAVAAGATKRIGGNWDPEVYNQTDGSVYVDYSAVTTVTVAALDVQPN